jgi:hypothetical protein
MFPYDFYAYIYDLKINISENENDFSILDALEGAWLGKE